MILRLMLYFVRHGQTVWNRQLRLQGRGDSPLTRFGVELALRYGEYLREQVSEPSRVTIFTSPLGRAAQTAAIVADAIGTGAEAVEPDPLLAEHDVGDWEGLAWDEIEARYGATRDLLRDWDARPPRGETRREMLERARTWLAKDRRSGVAIVVSHGGFSRAFRGAYLGLEPSEIGTLPTHDHGRLFELRSGRVVLHAAWTEPMEREAALG